MSPYTRFTIQATLLLLSSAIATLAKLDQESIHINLIHRDSSLSPLYNPQESSYDRVKKSFLRSKSRLSYLINEEISGDFQGDIEANEGEYLVKVSIGTPPVEMLAVMATASELVWMQCHPCTSCNSQTLPIFDSSKSSTYKNIACNSSKCELLPNFVCDPSDRCSFFYGSTERISHSNSLLGSDIFKFETSNHVDFPIKDVTFGCLYDDENTTPRQYNGILGLGIHNLSLVLQMSSIAEPIFTYCLGNHSDSEAENRLVLGNGMFPEGQTTSLKITEGRYSLLLEDISVGTNRLQIPPEIFQPSLSGAGGVMIDTGTTLTFLARDAYYLLVEELEGQLDLDIEIWPDPPYERCYNGKLSNTTNFPGVVFHFERGMNVLLDVPNLFLQVEDSLFCLAVLPSPLGGASVLGNLFQQSYSVGYHLREMLVSFQRINCEVLEKNLSS